MLARAPRRGFTYLGLIILVAIIGMVGAASLKIGSLLQRAAAEEELLAIGAAFSDALRSYAAATPRGQPQQPQTLQDLLKDPRFPNTRRHLRKIFVDPVTGKAEWGVMYLGDKVGVLGVYSLSQAQPLKVANFDARFLNMENKQHLSEWKFTMSSQTMPPAQMQPGAVAPAGEGAPPSLFMPPAGLPPGTDKGDTEKALAERAAAERIEAARAQAEQAEADAEKAEAEKAEAEKMEAEKAEAEKAEAEKTQAEKTEAERAAKADTMKADPARRDAEKTETDKTEAEKTEADKGEERKDGRPETVRPPPVR